MSDLPPLPLTRASVESAYQLIKNHIHRTPVFTNRTLNRLASTPQDPSALINTPFAGRRPARPKINFFFKCENFQRIGAFKSRGAFHALARLSDAELRNGVVTHSSGNHAQALALAARTRGIPAYIVMPTISSPTKVEATKDYGATIIPSGSTSTEREAVTAEVIKRTGAVLIPPYDHPDIILGQGTTALEMEAQIVEMVAREPTLSVRYQKKQQELRIRLAQTSEIPNPPQSHRLDALLVPCGGGGLLSGCATALAGTGVRVFGAEPSFQGADDARRSLARGARIDTVRSLTIADGLRTPLGVLPWSVVRNGKLVRGVFAVTERQICWAMRLVLERMKLLVEPSAVVGLAVALWDEDFRALVEDEVEKEDGIGNDAYERGWDVGVVLSGGNVGVEALKGLFIDEEGREVEVEEVKGEGEGGKG